MTTNKRLCGTYLSDIDLNRSAISGCDEPVGGGALPGNVEVDNILIFVLHLLKTTFGYLIIITFRYILSSFIYY